MESMPLIQTLLQRDTGSPESGVQPGPVDSNMSSTCERHQSGSAITGKCDCDPVALPEESRGHSFTRLGHTNVPQTSSEIWTIPAEADVSGMGIPALDFKHRSQAWERFRKDTLTIIPGHDDTLEKRVSEYFERVPQIPPANGIATMPRGE